MSLLLLFSNSVNQFWAWGCRASQTSLPLIAFPLQVFKCVLVSTAAERRSPCQISNFSVGFQFQLSPSAAKKRQLKDSKKTHTHGYTQTALHLLWAEGFEQRGCEIRSFVLPLHMCRLSIKEIDREKQKTDRRRERERQHFEGRCT